MAEQAEETELKVLGRQEIALTAFPAHQVRFYNGAKIHIPAGKTIYLTRDSEGVAKAFAKEFQKLKLAAQIIDATPENIPDLPDAAGLVLIPDTFSQPMDDALAGRFLLTAFSMASKNGPYLTASAKAGGSFMACVSFLGGGFGFKNFEPQISPVYGGMAGLAKTAALEWKPVLCRALDLPFDPKAVKENAEAAVAMMMTRGAVEMGLDGEHCYIPELISKPVGEPLAIGLDQSDVVMISGGARGVTAACAIALAKQCGSKIALLGRSKPPFEEPAWLKGMDTPAQMKKAIFANAFEKEKPTPARVEAEYRHFASNRDIKANLARIQKWGNDVVYYCVDIRDKDLVSATMEQVTRQLGPVTALIHGAGVLEDKLICEKTPGQFKTVFETKINGLFALLSSMDQDKLKYLVMFSSVAARFGNTGQCDYAMANEVLNKIAQAKQSTLPHCRAIAINWGPWDGGMVTDALKREFEKRRIELIPIQAGARQMVAEMGNTDGACVEVVVGGTIPSDLPEPSAVMNKVLTQTFSSQDSCIIEAHKIDNAPVVPLALMVDLLACGAEKNNPGLQFAGMEQVQLLKGIVPGDGQITVQVDIGKCTTIDHQQITSGRIISSGKNELSIQHARAQVILADTLPQPPVLPKSASMDLAPWDIRMDQAYDTILFHEGELQCISDIGGVSPKGIEVMTTTAPDISTWYKAPHARQWAMDPMVLDAAFQAAILWAFHNCGQVCLPASFANLRLFHDFPRQSGHKVRIIFTVNHQDRHKIKGYFTFLDENDTVIASMMGFEAVMDPGLLDKFKSPPLFDRDKILAFAQGNPSEAFGEPYKVFDEEREIARLPRPPYFFMDAVIKADHPAWQTAPGGWIETTYKIDKNAWYFTANHSDTMPFCILLEVALQPCGWLAAYGGAALISEERLHFRNLGGKAKLVKNLTRASGSVKIRVRMTDVSKAGGMIIQNFDMDVQNRGESVYTGTTNFGFFTADALSKQVGIREPQAFSPLENNTQQSVTIFEDHAPLTPEDKNIAPNTGMPGKALRMIDKITFLDFKAGVHGQGLIQGEKQVDPDEWFFHAHFYQDPVCPGSLGVESFLQLIRFFMVKKFDLNPEQFAPAIAENHEHEWTYRGQIIRSNVNIVVQAHISACTMDETGCRATADGTLSVDGICIYEMKNFCFSLQAISIAADLKKIKKISNPS
ncbi:SDR family NAD(P)-dependent oxidoreductase [Desulfobacter curvatus]|uniref:SDR family NAD(P)-dependent oxidoreductase n=1 Tax=Desulfobacter curvatus TaxID=2290 RepID=UPI00035E7148|nr:SDR family NAD(P)-dependent oxidoreductase [Desulfobacter curvatus]